MDDSKKRKVEGTSDGQPFSPASVEKMRLLLDPLRKDQLLDLLVKLGSQYPAVAEEIKGVASADPVHRKLFVPGLSWDATSESLCAAFAVHGEIEEGAVIVDKPTGKSPGYGFITYREMESTLRALKEPSKLINDMLLTPVLCVLGAVYAALDWPEEEWNKLIATTLTGSFLVSKHVCTCMRDANVKGSVINISSIAGLNCGQLPGGLAYAASKEAVNTMTKVMAMELGVYKIRVNSISPGLFKSEITEGLMQKTWPNNVALRTVPLRTYGTSDPALTSLVQYLIHDLSEYVSGNVFIVDAGATLPGIPIFSSL